MQWLAALCVRRPVFASVLILSLTVVGTFSFTQLGIDQFPNVDIPTILVTTRLPGAAPEQVESEVTDKIEEAVNTISGIDTLTSTSSEGVSQVVVNFTLDKDADVATQEVRDKVNRVLPLLPRTITQPTVEKRDPDAQPVLTVALTADEPLRNITEYADKVLRRRLESAEGVGQVLVLGGRRRQVNVWLDAEQLLAQGLTVGDVSRALQAQNSDVPGGRIEQGAQAITLRTRGRVESPDAFGDVVVREVRGHPILVRDVARIEDGMADAGTLASVNGDPTVLLQIRKQSGMNTVAIVNAVKDRLTELTPTLPPGYQLRIVRDQAEFIEASIESVQSHLVIGSALAALVVLLFLGNLRSTMIAAISIPTSIIATFGLVRYMDFTLNMLTMLALTLAVGIVIDDAIVVLENIYRFIEEKGMPPAQAAVEATKEIGLAVLATTMSLVAIFVPVGFMSGMVGRFMQSFGLTMAFAIMVSLLVSFTLTPMMCARWLKPKDRPQRRRARLQTIDDLWSGGSDIRPHARLGDGAQGCGGRAGRPRAPLERPALPDRERHLHHAGRSVGIRRHCPRHRGHEPRSNAVDGQPVDDGDSTDPGGQLHTGHGGGRWGRNAERRVNLRQARAHRCAGPRPVRDHGRSPRGDRVASRRARHPSQRRWWWRGRRGRRAVRAAGPRGH